jgi:hypothetical protein
MEMKKYNQQKLAKFAPILGIVYNPFKPTWAQKSPRIKVPNALALPILLCESKIWILRHKDKKRPTSMEMKIFK